MNEQKIEHKEIKKEEEKQEHKIEQKKEEVKSKIAKKNEALAIVSGASISKKHGMYICNFIKGKSIDVAINQLQEVLLLKRAIPFKGEIPHRHELGGKPGRFPINASKVFINLLKGLKGNAIVNQMDLSKTKISFASTSWASRPAKRGGARFKRAYILLKAKEFGGKE